MYTNSQIDIYMREKYIFPYDFLDDISDDLAKKPDAYNIYYVLKGSRYIIKPLDESTEPSVNFYIENCLTEERTFISGAFIKNIISSTAIQIVRSNITDNKSVLELYYVDMNERSEDTAKEISGMEDEPRNREIKRIRIHAIFLLWWKLAAECQNMNYIYELLYVGQTMRNNSAERLMKHEVIARIARDMKREDDGDKCILYIMLSGVHVKKGNESRDDAGLLFFKLGKRLPHDFELSTGRSVIEREDAVNIAEAMMINYFKPRYNIIYKNTNELENLKAFETIREANIKEVCYSIDLSGCVNEDGTIILKTETVETERKATLLLYDFAEDGSGGNLRLETLPDCLY